MACWLHIPQSDSAFCPPRGAIDMAGGASLQWDPMILNELESHGLESRRARATSTTARTQLLRSNTFRSCTLSMAAWDQSPSESECRGTRLVDGENDLGRIVQTG